MKKVNWVKLLIDAAMARQVVFLKEERGLLPTVKG